MGVFFLFFFWMTTTTLVRLGKAITFFTFRMEETWMDREPGKNTYKKRAKETEEKRKTPLNDSKNASVVVVYLSLIHI